MSRATNPSDPVLPIEACLPALGAALQDRGRAVLQAPPGAGKTTRVPLFLDDAGLVGGRIIMLEPRRVAARAAAGRLADLRGEAPGESVGYRMRGETAIGPSTKIEVVTEGVLTRMIQSDPELAGVGCLIFDEFHERSLTADLGLALALDLADALRPDLKLLVMSATLDAAPVAALMGDVPLVTSEGRAFPVETVHLSRPLPAGHRDRRHLPAHVADLVATAAATEEGGILTFLPGRYEIDAVARLLRDRLGPGDRIELLHGSLPFADQKAVLRPRSDGGRKIVLSTAIAETSVTIPDIRVVVDAGMARRARFDPGTGMSRLVTERVSRAEAEQRRGRAGRVAPGRCYRLWAAAEEGALPAFAPPEILREDLTGMMLDLAQWGAADPADLPLLTAPPTESVARARALLRDLGALDPRGGVTPHGRAMARLPVHPRLAHMLLSAAGTRRRDLAVDLAALLEHRDPLRGSGGRPPADIALRLSALRDPKRLEAETPYRVDRAARAQIVQDRKRLAARVPEGEAEGPSLGGLLSLAYPDRIAARRPGDAPRFHLSGGSGAALDPGDALAHEPMLAVAGLEGDRREARILLAAPASSDEVRRLHCARETRHDICRWDARHGRVEARRETRIGALKLEDAPWTDPPADQLLSAQIDGVRALGLSALGWGKLALRFLDRARWLAARGADLPDLSEAALLEVADDWLAPAMGGARTREALSKIDPGDALRAWIGWDRLQEIDRLAPASITAPTGTVLPIDYGGDAPSVSVRLQEMFGLTVHPVIGPDRLPLSIALLSPAQRPVQITSDLPGFWASSYADVRRDLRGRYPRHPWPEDPAAAPPTRRAKPRSQK
ncbi:ATP-dependent helicase HrpB [Oceanomicrobium pacificus]|uniref:ATP-dependent helicase HrpB n=1 Tax=Oceanomicrobium pacificus TaxID=2692916 RepID=A0A6B0TYS5_9RHOB|nr:ATP-dependent helicase HrpB [Oceanomicrobium pacificus]MXU66578.1 ATP-dependent helicase HrpB [Oceanomicrobium pacificus]